MEAGRLHHEYIKRKEELLELESLHTQVDYHLWKLIRKGLSQEELEIELIAVRGFARAANDLKNHPDTQSLRKMLDEKDYMNPSLVSVTLESFPETAERTRALLNNYKKVIERKRRELNDIVDAYNQLEPGFSKQREKENLYDSSPQYWERYEETKKNLRDPTFLLKEYDEYAAGYTSLANQLEGLLNTYKTTGETSIIDDYEDALENLAAIENAPDLIRHYLERAGYDVSQFAQLPSVSHLHFPPWREEQLRNRVRRAEESLRENKEKLKTLENKPYQNESLADLRLKYTTMNPDKFRPLLPKNASEERLREAAKADWENKLSDAKKGIEFLEQRLTESRQRLEQYLRDAPAGETILGHLGPITYVLTAAGVRKK